MTNPPDHGREMNHQVRSRLIKQTHDVGLLNQIVFATARHEDFYIRVRLESLYHKTTEKPGAARNRDSLVREFAAQSKIKSPFVPGSRKTLTV